MSFVSTPLTSRSIDSVVAAATSEPMFVDRLRSRWERLLDLPTYWNEWDFLQPLLSGLLQIAVVGLFWWIARGRLPRALTTLVRLRLSRREDLVVPRNFWNLDPVLHRIGAASVDLIACFLILPLLRTALPELGLAVLVYEQVALFRLGTALVALSLAEHPQVRPALRTLRPTTRDLALKTVRLALLWGIARGFLIYVAQDLLQIPDVVEPLRLVFFGLLFVFVLWCLHTWEKPGREMLLRHYPDNTWLVRICRPKLTLLRFLRTPFLGMIGFLLMLREMLRNRADWFAGWLHRRDAEQPTGTINELPPELLKTLLKRECDQDEYVERKKERELFYAELGRWDLEKRRGVITLIGDEGAGKHVFLDHLARELETEGRDIVRLRLRDRLTTKDHMIDWLASSFELEQPPREAAALGARLNEHLAGKIIVLEALHLTFLRQVGGFDAVRVLLRVIAAGGGRVFWVLSLHRPAWLYLGSTGLLDTGLCEPILEISGFSADQLRRLVMTRTRTAGFETTFTHLAPRRPPGHVSYTLERAEKEYFRRLAWVSKGNPAVALRLWRETLRPHPYRPDLLEVERFCYLRRLPELRDVDLFVLIAIQTHRAISRSELVEVTNMGPGDVQTALSKLEGLRLISTRSHRYSIEPLYLPAVIADLRRRHMLYDEV